jgi:hypothetical protein
MGSKPVFAFTKEESEAFGKARRNLSGDALQAAVPKALRLPARRDVPDYRILRRSRHRQSCSLTPKCSAICWTDWSRRAK